MNSSTTRTAIVVFTQAPTQEQKNFGAGRRRDLALLEWLRARTLATVSRIEAPLFVASDEPGAHLPAHATVIPQSGPTFEARLLGALRTVRDRGFERIVVVGSDTPGLCEHDLRRALDPHNAFVGPSRDGGFYLLGITASTIERLAGLPWGRRQLFDSLLARLDGPICRGTPRADLDNAGDLNQLTVVLRRIARLLLGQAVRARVRRHRRLFRVPQPALTVRDVSPWLCPPYATVAA